MDIEKALRQYVRSQFGARVQKIDGYFQSQVKSTHGLVRIDNPDQVKANLESLCGKPISMKGHTTTYKYKATKNNEVVVTLTTHHKGGSVLRVYGVVFGE